MRDCEAIVGARVPKEVCQTSPKKLLGVAVRTAPLASQRKKGPGPHAVLLLEKQGQSVTRRESAEKGVLSNQKNYQKSNHRKMKGA